MNPKHRMSRTSPRSGAAALMIGGLVAGTMATAGATSLKSEDTAESAQGGAAGSLANALKATTSDSEGAAAVSNLSSLSLAELREDASADRSEARTAPEDTPEFSSLLADSAFSGSTVTPEPEPEAVEPEVAEPEVAEPEVAEPEAVEPEVAEPEVAEPETVETTEPVAEQASAEPVAAAPQESTTNTQTQAQTDGQSSTGGSTETTTPDAPAPAAGGSVLSIAASYVGTPYQLLGPTPATFDCSSYTQYVFQQAGISIPATVSGQKAAVTPVSNPQPGDLVFYNDFYHVGIYAGNGMTYEALNPSAGTRYGKMISDNVWYGRVG